MLPEGVCDWGAEIWGYRAARVVVGLVLLGVGVRLYQYRVRRKRRARWAAAGQDVVVLHQFERGVSCPNISPFALKVETFLRANNVTYVVDESQPFGPLSKCPWITFNGEEMTDSDFIIRSLSSRLGISMDAGLSERERALGRAVRVMLEERTAWGIFLKRYVLDGMRHVWREFPAGVRKYVPFVKYLLPYGYKKRAREQGIGRFTEPEVLHQVQKDVQAVSRLLGEQQFMLGERVSELDCCVFGMVVQLLYVSGPSLEFWTRERCDNLVRHCDRMRRLYWQDWDQCLQR